MITNIKTAGKLLLYIWYNVSYKRTLLGNSSLHWAVSIHRLRLSILQTPTVSTWRSKDQLVSHCRITLVVSEPAINQTWLLTLVGFFSYLNTVNFNSDLAYFFYIEPNPLFIAPHIQHGANYTEATSSLVLCRTRPQLSLDVRHTVCVHGNEGTFHAVQQCLSLMSFTCLWTTMELCRTEEEDVLGFGYTPVSKYIEYHQTWTCIILLQNCLFHI